MKKIFFVAAVSAFAFLFTSCNNDDDFKGSGRTADLRIETEIAGMPETYAPVSVFAENAKLSLWVTPGTLGSNYNLGPYNNVLATFKSNKWELTPQVKLSDTPAIIYAFYPYATSYTNGKDNMTVYHTNQVDYMYGSNAEGYESVDRSNPNVKLRMKHALSLHQFRINKMNYPGEAKLTRVEAYNNGKTDMSSALNLNIASGEFTYISGIHHNPAFVENTNGLITIPDAKPTEEKDFVNLLVMPVGKTSAVSSVAFKFIIDGVSYTYGVPINTTWKQGTKYIYNVTLNGTELTIDDITITDWVTGTENNMNLY